MTGLGFEASGDSGARCLLFLRMMAVGVFTACCSGLPVPFKTTSFLSPVQEASTISSRSRSTNNHGFFVLLFLKLMVDVSLLDDGC